MGLDVYVWKQKKGRVTLGHTTGEEGRIRIRTHNGKQIEMDSAKHPDHMFKVGYFRSSYNSAGVNKVLHQLTGKTMFNAFKEKIIKEADYEFVPDWDHALKVLKKIRKQLQKSDLFRSEGLPVDRNYLESEKDALRFFKKEYAKNVKEEDLSSYESREGSFYMNEPLDVYGIMPGVMELFGGNMEPCVYIVYKMKDVDWYIEAVDIMIETCELAVNDKKSEYFLVWDG